jgi:hypothetical protein
MWSARPNRLRRSATPHDARSPVVRRFRSCAAETRHHEAIVKKRRQVVRRQFFRRVSTSAKRRYRSASFYPAPGRALVGHRRPPPSPPPRFNPHRSRWAFGLAQLTFSAPSRLYIPRAPAGLVPSRRRAESALHYVTRDSLVFINAVVHYPPTRSSERWRADWDSTKLSFHIPAHKKVTVSAGVVRISGGPMFSSLLKLT